MNREVRASLYEEPPVPKWKQEVAKESYTTVDELSKRAEMLRGEAEALQNGGEAKPSSEVKLGEVILCLDEKAIDLLLSRWDAKGKGEYRGILIRAA